MVLKVHGPLLPPLCPRASTAENHIHSIEDDFELRLRDPADMLMPTICEMFATESLGNPVRRGFRSMLPGPRPNGDSR